jgi:hypothetical protein
MYIYIIIYWIVWLKTKLFYHTFGRFVAMTTEGKIETFACLCVGYCVINLLAVWHLPEAKKILEQCRFLYLSNQFVDLFFGNLFI